MADIKEYKCPCCGGAIEFDSSIQKLKCPYCDTEFEIDNLKDYAEEVGAQGADDMSWDSIGGSEWSDEDLSSTRVYICKSCGGEIVGNETTSATSCPYCDNPVVMTGNLSGALKPDFVIPFKLDKNAAKEGLMKHLKGKRLLPKVFKDENHIDEVKGIYVPFWLFDADVEADIRYRATRVRTWSDRNYEYTRTSYYSAFRSGNVGFDKVPVDGASRIDDDLMESIEPFDFGEAVDFKTAYLAGYFADKYDVDAEHSIDRANQRIKTSTEDVFAETVKGFTTVTPEQTSVRLSNARSHYALYPVWLLNTTWRDKKYVFAMNGQTGKFVGNLPIDKAAFCKWFAGLTALITAICFVISYFMWLLG